MELPKILTASFEESLVLLDDSMIDYMIKKGDPKQLYKRPILGRGAVYEDAETGSDRFADYMGAIYPTGINPEKRFFFNMRILIKLCLPVIQMKKKSVFWRFMMNGNKV